MHVGRMDWFFLALMIVGVSAGLGYVFLTRGWIDALGAWGVVCFAAGLLGGLRR